MTTTQARRPPVTRTPMRATRRAAARANPRPRARPRRRWGGWAIAGLLTVVAVIGVAWAGRSTSATTNAPAAAFNLASTAGGNVALSDYRGRNVLLYFNEGIGCDACFYQTAKLEADAAFTNLGVPLVPIVMNDIGQVQTELGRFGIRTPYLSDPDGSISRAYGTLGTGHHANLPGHSLVLVGPDGTIRWRADYPGMWVEPSQVVATVKSYTG